MLYKIIGATDENFKPEGKADRKIAKMSSGTNKTIKEIKNELLHFSKDEEVPI